MKAKISLAKSPTHKEGVTKTLDGVREQLETKLSEIDELTIKINFVKVEPELATTPFEAVKHFIEYIRPFYKKEIIIAEQASFGSTSNGFKKYGFTELAESDPEIRLLNLGKDKGLKKEIKYNGGSLNLSISKTMVETPFLVSITRPKTHNTVVVTLGVKNVLVGAIQGAFVQRKKIHQDMAIHEIMTTIAEFSYPDFVLLDGTEGMEGNGPTKGSPKKAGWSIASFDALAADTLAANLMGFKLDDIGYFNMLKDKGFGKTYPVDEIEITGETPQNLISPFKPHDTFEEQKNWKQ
ncbi:DUF362 domain-containing protein [Candidatus Dojkabacteria bacterium]|nr:DUF362 domain-containing protein [Candidatus Dojkabacteria bacterium]